MGVIKRKLAGAAGGGWYEQIAQGAVSLARYSVPSRTRAQREEQAFETLLEQSWDALWRYAFRVTGNIHDAEDLLSEAAIEGYKGFPKFRAETTFLRWMYRVMTTTRIDMLRKNKRHIAQSLDAVDDDGEPRVADIADSSAGPELRLLGEILSEPVQKAMNSLSEEFRAVVVLADMEQLDYTEVSAVLQIPVGTVRSRLHRARLQLRNALTSYVDEKW